MPTLSRPPGGSVNQIEPSDFTTMSLGLFSFLPCHLSASVFHVPFFSIRKTVRPPQPATTSRFSRSRHVPFALMEGLSTTSCPVFGLHFQIVSPMMSVKKNCLFFASQVGPSPKMMSRAMMSTGGLGSMIFCHPGAHKSTSTPIVSSDPCIGCSLSAISMSGRSAAGPGLRCERAMIRHDVDHDGFSRGERFFERRRYVGRGFHAQADTAERFGDACEVYLAEAPHLTPALV